ncbi:hypothetical protein [Pseudomonas pergaminensis]
MYQQTVTEQRIQLELGDKITLIDGKTPYANVTITSIDEQAQAVIVTGAGGARPRAFELAKVGFAFQIDMFPLDQLVRSAQLELR